MKKPTSTRQRKTALKAKQRLEIDSELGNQSPLWLTEALKIFKTQAAFAHALGVKPGAVTNWKRRGVPLEQCKDIARVTNNKIPAHKVRPDFFGSMAA